MDRKSELARNTEQDHGPPLKRRRRIVPEMECPDGTLCQVKHVRSYFHKPELSSADIVPFYLLKSHGKYSCNSFHSSAV